MGRYQSMANTTHPDGYWTQICHHPPSWSTAIFWSQCTNPNSCSKCRSTCGKNKSLDLEFLICALVALFLFWVNSFQWFGFRQTFYLSNILHKHHQYGHLLSHKTLPRKRLIHCPEWHLGNAEPLSRATLLICARAAWQNAANWSEWPPPIYTNARFGKFAHFGDVKYSSSKKQKNWMISHRSFWNWHWKEFYQVSWCMK